MSEESNAKAIDGLYDQEVVRVAAATIEEALVAQRSGRMGIAGQALGILSKHGIKRLRAIATDPHPRDIRAQTRALDLTRKLAEWPLLDQASGGVQVTVNLIAPSSRPAVGELVVETDVALVER